MKLQVAYIFVLFAFIAGLFIGFSKGQDAGISEDVANKYGDKWDCGYDYGTGFLLCDRTPKYKD